jgi:sulfur transfer protein SufE
MFLEDLRDHIARLNDKIAAMDKKSKHVIENYDEMEEETKRYRKMIELNQLEAERISKRSEIIFKEVADLKEEAKKLKL